MYVHLDFITVCVRNVKKLILDLADCDTNSVDLARFETKRMDMAGFEI